MNRGLDEFAARRVATASRLAEEWNSKHPVGTPVHVRPILSRPPEYKTRTRSAAWVIPSGSALVLIEGKGGGYSLAALDALTEKEFARSSLPPAIAVLFRRAVCDDLEQLRALQGACFAPELHDDDETIRQCIASDVHLVAEVNGQVVGAAVATTRPELAGASPLHLYVVEVHPEHRGRGVATTLVRQAFRAFPPSWIVMTANPVTPEGWRFLASFYPRIVPIGWPELVPNFFETAEGPVGGKRGAR